MALRNISQDSIYDDTNDQLSNDHTSGEWSLSGPKFGNTFTNFSNSFDSFPAYSFSELNPSYSRQWPPKDLSAWTSYPLAQGSQGLSRASSCSSDLSPRGAGGELQYAHLRTRAVRTDSNQSLADVSIFGADPSAEEGSQRYVCFECNETFESLQALDRHT